MPLFVVKCEVVTRYDGSIVVEAENAEKALEWAKQHHEYHDDFDALGEESYYIQTVNPLTVGDIRQPNCGIPKDWKDLIPWNSKTDETTKEVMEKFPMY